MPLYKIKIKILRALTNTSLYITNETLFHDLRLPTIQKISDGERLMKARLFFGGGSVHKHFAYHLQIVEKLEKNTYITRELKVLFTYNLVYFL